MRFWQEGRWRDLSYRELGRGAFEIAGGLMSLGVRPGDRVSILAGTRPEWTLADLGALCAGAVVAPIYHTNSPEECRYILEHAGSRVVFCEGTDQLAKVTQVRAHCPLLEHVITLDGGAAISLHELRHIGREGDAGRLERIAATVRPEDLASVVYTSGTTGPPKGCMITNANLMRTAAMYEQQIDLEPGSVVFTFLPLAHLLARVTQMVVLDVGGTLAYWRGDTRQPRPLTCKARARLTCRRSRVYWRRSTRARCAGPRTAGDGDKLRSGRQLPAADASGRSSAKVELPAR